MDTKNKETFIGEIIYETHHETASFRHLIFWELILHMKKKKEGDKKVLERRIERKLIKEKPFGRGVIYHHFLSFIQELEVKDKILMDGPSWMYNSCHVMIGNLSLGKYFINN